MMTAPPMTVRILLEVVVDVPRALDAAEEYRAPDLATLLTNEIVSNLEGQPWITAVTATVLHR